MTAVGAAPSRRTWQRVAAWVLVVLTGIAIAGSVIGLWVHRTVLDTDAFMASVTPIVESESVQTVVSDRVGDQLVQALALEERLGERLSEAERRLLERLATALDLPDAVVRRLEGSSLGLDALAPMIAAGVESRIRDAVATFVSSPEGTRLLLETIATAHERSVHLLRDELDELPNVVVEDGEVRLNLVPVVAEVLRSVVNSGLDVIGVEREIPPFDSAEDATAAVERLATVVGRELAPDFGQVRLASEASLERAQGLVRAFDLALWVLVITALLLGLLAIWLAPTIPAGIIRVGVAAALAAIVGWLAVQLISSQIADAAATVEGRAAVGDIVDALVSGLSGTALALALVGIGVVAAAILADRQSASPAAVTASPAPSPPPAAPAPAPPSPEAPRARTARSAKTASAKPAPAKAPSARTTSAKTKPGEQTGDAPPSASAETKKRRRPPAAGA
jgi:hypothetical protein